jgi:hypothetical protein
MIILRFPTNHIFILKIQRSFLNNVTKHYRHLKWGKNNLNFHQQINFIFIAFNNYMFLFKKLYFDLVIIVFYILSSKNFEI